MAVLVHLVATYATWLYIAGTIAALYYLREWAAARRAARETLFGLEREAAGYRQVRAGLMLVIVVASMGIIALLTYVVAPGLGGVPVDLGGAPTTEAPFVATPPTSTPTLRPTPTLTSTPRPTPPPLPATDTPAPTAPLAESPTPAGPPPPVAGCGDPNQYLSSPLPGSTVSGIVSIYGTADIAGFFYYKFEVSGDVTNGEWATTATFQQPVRDGFLGSWDTATWPPGNYRLRLVVVDNTGNFPEPCVVELTVQASGP